MRRTVFFTMAMLSGVVAFGQSLLDCMEPDVLRALLLQSQGERPLVVTAAVPTEVSALRMPSGFAWIGSAERIAGRVDATTNASQVTAAWRSSLAPDAARAAVASALKASGWEVRALLSAGMSVFSSSSMNIAQTACREGKPVNFNASAMEGVTYVLITIQRGNSNNSGCSQPAQPVRMTGTGLDASLPRLEMPVDPATGAVALMRGGGSGGSPGGSLTARAEFTIRDSASNVARHFARQMAEQGWTSDANWSGASTAGSSWSRRDAGALVQGTLSVTALDDRQFLAVLRISKLQ